MNKYIIFAVVAAIFYSLSIPFSKLLLDQGITSTMLAGLLYLGAGIGMTFIHLKEKVKNKQKESFSKSEKKYIYLMIVLDILAPIALMMGLELSNSETVSLLNNFEIVATSLIAYFLFREKIRLRLWIGLVIITIATIILSIQNIASFSFSLGSFFVILACVFWGFENNCTKQLSQHSVHTIVLIKGVFSGLGSLLVAFLMNELIWNGYAILFALILGFISYGLSVYFYVYAQRGLGASKTSAFYAIAPFFGVALSFVLFFDSPKPTFYLALILMILGTYFVSMDLKNKKEQ